MMSSTLTFISHEEEFMGNLDAAAKIKTLEAANLAKIEVRKSMVRAIGAPKGKPSPPGLPPHIQTGKLRRAIRVRWLLIRGVAVLTAEVFYGKFHEFGTRFLPKRPFLRPAVMRVMKRFPQLFANLDVKQTSGLGTKTIVKAKG